jgi:hypothetical protein
VEVPDGTVADVFAWVGGDPERARLALDAERQDQQRTTLITELERLRRRLSRLDLGGSWRGLRGCATFAAMLLNSLIRGAAITGRTDAFDSRRVNAFFGGRQGGRWAQQTVAAAIPTAAPHVRQVSPPPEREPSDAETLRELTKLRQRGVVTDAEFEKLRAELHV